MDFITKDKLVKKTMTVVVFILLMTNLFSCTNEDKLTLIKDGVSNLKLLLWVTQPKANINLLNF